MDLDYPSQKKTQLSHQLNHNNIDHRFGSIILSTPKIPISSDSPISPRIKQKLISTIIKDQPMKLLQLLQTHKICIHDQISKQGYLWNVLHYIAKNNSNKCMDLCLRLLYQNILQHEQEKEKEGKKSVYEEIVNSRNCDGDTPLILACIYKANDVIKCILQYGGTDIYAFNGKKLTAYQIALNGKNQQALQMLMKYQLKIKRKISMNYQLLSVPIIRQDRTGGVFWKFCNFVMECFHFQKISQIVENKQTQTDRNMIKKYQTSSDPYSSCSTTNSPLPNIEIFWSQPQKQQKNRLPIFSTISNPFLLKQSNIIVSNLFIIFQVLAEHPQMLKRIIYPISKNNQDEDKNNNIKDNINNHKYYVRFLTNKKQSKLILLDNLFPYFQETKQPLFLSLDDQLWPMILQKALCQLYNGYFQPAKVPISQILQTITGNQVYRLSFLKINNAGTKQQGDQYNQWRSQIIAKIMKIQSKNCLLILQANSDCPLKAQQGRIQCFSLLKILGQKFLVNCPFLITNNSPTQQKPTTPTASPPSPTPTSQKSITITRQMKLHQSHYQNQNCTTMWLNIDQFFNYFSQALYCHTLNFNSSTMKDYTIKLTPQKRRVYISLKIKNNPTQKQSQKYRNKYRTKQRQQQQQNISTTNMQQNKIYLNFQNQTLNNSNNNNTNQYINVTTCVGWQIASQNRSRSYIQKLNCQVVGHVQISDINSAYLENNSIMQLEIIIMCQFQQKYLTKTPQPTPTTPTPTLNLQNHIIMSCKSNLFSQTNPSQLQINIQPLDCTIGDLEFIQHCKKYYKQNYQQYKNNPPIIQVVGDYLLIMAISEEQCYIPFTDVMGISQDNIVEGVFVKEAGKQECKLEMLVYEDQGEGEGERQYREFGIYFAVLCGVPADVGRVLKIMSFQKDVINEESVQASNEDGSNNKEDKDQAEVRTEGDYEVQLSEENQQAPSGNSTQ